MEWVKKLAPAGGAWTEEEILGRALSAPPLVAHAIEVLGIPATSWAVEAAGRAVDRVHDREVAAGFPAPSTGRDKQASEAAFLSLMIGLATEEGFDVGWHLSEDLTGIVRAASRQGIPLDVLLNRVWGIHTVTRDELIAALQHVGPLEAESLQTVSVAMFDYANAFAHRVAEAYEHERKAWRGRRTDEQQQIIAAVVDGALPPERSALDAHWEGGHLYALGWLEQQGYIADADGAIGEFANRTAGALGADRVIVLEREGAVQLWWNAPGRLAEGAASIIASVKRPEWLRVAIGPEGVGVAGFRDSVQGARLAERVARLPEAADRGVWRFDEVGHLALLAEDRSAAAWFVRRELGPLAGPGARMTEIRDTVRLYLGSGNSRVAVAKALHLAPNTVAYRVGQANELLGRSVGDRAQQVLLALQIAHVLPGLLA